MIGVLMKKIEFSKLNGQGNDFIIIDNTKNEIKLSKNQIIGMCNRNFGIGADGLILVRKSKISDLKMNYYNKDGSVSEMCGNGIRCLARFAWEKNIIKSNKINIETLSGVKEILIESKDKKVGNIKVNMGIPEFKPEKIPVKLKNTDEVFNYKITAGEKDFYINCVSIGNPHCVIFLESYANLENFPVCKYGRIIENKNIFPNKTNVEFVKVKSENEIDMGVWERGVGETLACGSGACAAVVCAIKLKEINCDRDGKVYVNLPGGRLNVYWNGPDNNVCLEGEVSYKFDGIYFL
jgi:diaminopimelate epimerase